MLNTKKNGRVTLKLENVQEGMYVVGKDDYYEGLVGTIDVIRRDKTKFETENDTEMEIVVDFVETDDIEESHPELNGTSVDQLIMGEDELIFFPEGLENDGYDIEGNEYTLNDVISKYKDYDKKIKQEYL
jgi:hypothetical protein